MRNYNQSFQKLTINTLYADPSGNILFEGNVDGVAGNPAMVVRSLTSDPIIQGNHKDPNPWSYDIRVLQPRKGKYTHYYEPWGFAPSASYRGGLEPGPAVYDFTPLFDESYQIALGRMNEKVRGDLDLAVDIAQWKQTRDQISTTVDRYATFLRKFKTLRRASKTLAEEWLAYQYGWKPLIQDIYAAAEEAVNVRVTNIRNLRTSSTRRIFQDYVGVHTVDTNKPIQGFTSTYGTVTTRITLKLDVGYDLDKARWSSLNPVSIAWELIPYSFVVDWFVDVGSYIRDYETAMLYNTAFKSGYVSQFGRVRSDEKIKGTYMGPSSPRTLYEWDSEAWMYRKYFRRSILTSYPFPLNPSFKVNLGWQRILSAASLTRAAFR